MTCDCPTCQCDHAGKFPRFTLYYADDSEVRGGGPEDKDLVVYALPRSWVEAPGLGLTIALSEDPVVGRRTHKGMELVYALAHGTRGGPDIAPTGPETQLIPAMCGQYGFAKLGEHANTQRYHDIMLRAQADTHVPMASAGSTPFELQQARR